MNAIFGTKLDCCCIRAYVILYFQLVVAKGKKNHCRNATKNGIAILTPYKRVYEYIRIGYFITSTSKMVATV